jgi:hypothetical protein
MIKWTDKNLESRFAEDLIANLRFCILVNGIKCNKLPIGIFQEYLKRPRELNGDFSSKFSTEFYKKSDRSVYNRYWRKISSIPEDLMDYSTQRMHEVYVCHILRNEEKKDWLSKYFDETYLMRKKIMVELESGGTVPKNMSKYFNEQEIQKMRSEKRLLVEEYTKKQFSENEKVEIFLRIKGLDSVVVKTFEIDCQAYYRKHGSPFSELIDLDGLLPTYTQELNLAGVSPLSTIRRGFAFPDIQSKTRGIFVIEFQGGGMSTRAVIKKGGLTLINQPTSQGVIFNVVNEKKELCKGEGIGILFSGQYYKCDSKGDILIPYSTSQVSGQAVVIYGGFADLVPVSIPSENYAFLTSLQFNEESLVPGNMAKLIVHPKLIFNGRAINISLVKNVRATISSTNDQGVKASSLYNNITLSYDNDLVLDYLVPPKLRQLEVRLDGTITLINGTELNVSTNEYIYIDKHEGTDIYFDVYLQQSSDGYSLRLLGKNGEPLQKKVLLLHLHNKYLRKSNVEMVEMKTDAEGRIRLGQLAEITKIGVDFSGSGLGLSEWEINRTDEQMHVQNNYLICVGEELLLPSVGKELSRAYVQLTRHSRTDQRLLSDAFSNVSKKGSFFVLKMTTPGLYNFEYLDLKQKVTIEVTEGQRWKYANNFIVENQSLSKMVSDLSYMSLESYEMQNNKLTFRIKCNNQSKLKAHILGYRMAPKYLNEIHEVTRKMCPHYNRDTYGFPYYENSYLSERQLPDELAYVLARKQKPSPIGNTLEKPPALLKRHYNKDTAAEEEKLNEGTDFKNADLGKNAAAFMKTDKAKLSMPPPRTLTVERLSEFMTGEGIMIPNVKANERGEFVVTLPNLEGYSFLRVLVSDVMANISFDVPLKQSNFKLQDQRLSNSKTEGLVYSAHRTGQAAIEGQTVVIDDIKSTESLTLDSLESAFDVIKALSQYADKSHQATLEKWRFLTEWNSLDQSVKQRYFEDFSSHELHIFIYFKDRPFFTRFVQPYLHSKSRLDTVDWLLLYPYPSLKDRLITLTFAEMRPVEMFLAVYRALEAKDETTASSLITVIESIVSAGTNGVEKTGSETFNKLFDTVLNHQMAAGKQEKGADQAEYNPTSGVSPKLLAANWQSPQYCPQDTPEGARAQKRSRRHHQHHSNHNEDEDMNYSALSVNYQEQNSIRHSARREASVEHSSGSEPEEADKSNSENISASTPKRVNKKMKAEKGRKKMDEEDLDESCCDMSVVNEAIPEEILNLRNDAIIDDIPLNQNKQVVQYKKTETTKEYIERNYYFNNDIGLSKLNSFWLNLVKGLFEKGTDFVCLDHNFILCTNTLSEMLLCLALLGLPYSKATLSTKRDGNKLTIECKEGRIIQFCKVMNETSAGRVDLDIIVSQRFYDPQDKHLFDEQNPHLATLKKVDEFLIGKIYTSRVAVTNSSDSDVEFELICEIPQGSIPVNDLDYTKTYAITCRPLETLIKEFSFYFPQEGTFSIFPATAIKSSQLITYAHLSEKQLRVVKRKTAKGMMDSISEILVSGQKKDILSFMETKNIRNSKIFNFNEIYWLFKDEKFYLQAVDILRRRFIFDQTTWAFSILHGAKREYFEYLTYTKKNFGIKYLALGDFRIDDFEIKEYSPLTNPRTHNIGNKKHNINNKEFKSTYISFLKYCLFKNDLDNRDRLVLSSYLVLQDRVDEAMAQMSGIVRNQDLAEEELKIQLDYLTAYLSLYNEYPKFPTAKGLSDKYINYHVPTWRNRFVRIANQLSEVSGANAIIETEEKVIGNEQKISKAEMLKVELRDNSIIAKSRNVDHVTVSYYEVDIEVLFSKDPFSNKDMTNTFSDVFPSHREVVKIGSGIDEVEKHIPIPEKLINKNMVIYVQTALLSEKVQFCPSALSLIVATEAGYVKVLGPDRKPLPQVYVKTFSLSGGNTAFYKDGYTDMRGVFDYSSLNLDKLDQIDRLALLVCSSTYGAVTRVVPKPSKLGQVVDNEVLVGAGQGNKTTEIY